MKVKLVVHTEPSGITIVEVDNVASIKSAIDFIVKQFNDCNVIVVKTEVAEVSARLYGR